jgi:AraC-like DNA-binding protein
MAKHKARNHQQFTEYDAELHRKGMMIVDSDVTRPKAGESYISSDLIIMITCNGSMKGEYDMLECEFNAHDLTVVYPNHALMVRERSEDYKAIFVAVSAKNYAEFRGRVSYRNPLALQSLPTMNLDDMQYEAVMNVVSLVRNISAMGGSGIKELNDTLLEFITRLVTKFREDAFPLVASNKQLFAKFYDALTEHYQESREVRFYAELMCLSPKYFGSVIKQETGIGACQWIASFVVMQAKQILKMNKGLSIQQVSDRLGFPDQASFSRYFKRSAGISPLEYREKYR